MKYLILISLLVGCNTKPDMKKIKQNAENYCSCNKGVWYIRTNSSLYDAFVKCNGGQTLKFDEEDVVYRWCQ